MENSRAKLHYLPIMKLLSLPLIVHTPPFKKLSINFLG